MDMTERTLRNVVRRVLAEAKGDNLALAMEILTGLDLGELDVKGNLVRIKVPRSERNEAMNKAVDALQASGFDFNPSQTKSSLGHIEKLDRADGSVYVVIKPTGGGAATVGQEFENKIAALFLDDLGEECDVDAAGFGHGSDVTVKCGGKQVLGVETKSSSGADFGQFSIGYDDTRGEWVVRDTKNYQKQKGLVDTLWSVVQSAVNEKMKFDDSIDAHFRSKDSIISGLVASPTTGEFRKSLEGKWFDGMSSLNIPIDFQQVAGYYKGKGDDLLQIGNFGAWALQDKFSQIGIPQFSDETPKTSLRIRIKPSMGANGNHRFNVAIKMSGLKRPGFNLLDPDDRSKLEDFILGESRLRGAIRNLVLEIAQQYKPAEESPRAVALRLLEEHGLEPAMNIAARDGNFAVLKILADFGPDSASQVTHFPFGRM
jgi:hypothetical protein